MHSTNTYIDSFVNLCSVSLLKIGHELPKTLYCGFFLFSLRLIIIALYCSETIKCWQCELIINKQLDKVTKYNRGSLVKVTDLRPVIWVQFLLVPCESLLVAGRASGQNCFFYAPVKVPPWYLCTFGWHSTGCYTTFCYIYIYHTRKNIFTFLPQPIPKQCAHFYTAR